MDRVARDAGLVEQAREFVGTVLGAREDQGLADVRLAQQVEQQVAFARRIDRMRAVADGLGHGVDRRHLHLARLAQELLGELLERGLEGGAEQQGLALLGQAAEDALDRRQEAHVEHAVGLVQHQHLDLREVDAAAVEVVDQAAGRGDEHVDAAAQGIDLALHADAAVHGRHAQGQVPGVTAQAVVHLQGELARRRQHQRARTARSLAVRRPAGEVLQQGQAEGGGLAGAGLGAGDEVVAGQGERDRLVLDRGGRGVAGVGKGAQQGRAEPEGFEGHG